MKLDELIVALTRQPQFIERRPDEAEPTTPPRTTSTEPDAGDAAIAVVLPDAAPPPPPENLDVVDHVDSTWAMGACHTVAVTNTGDSAITWQITLALTGTLSQNWSSTAVVNGSQVTFSGADYNATIAPGETATFGYCVGNY